MQIKCCVMIYSAKGLKTDPIKVEALEFISKRNKRLV